MPMFRAAITMMSLAPDFQLSLEQSSARQPPGVWKRICRRAIPFRRDNPGSASSGIVSVAGQCFPVM